MAGSDPLATFLGAIVKGGQLIAETEADNAASAIQSREWNRAMRSEQAQAVDALARGGNAAGAARMRASRVLGQQRLAYAGSGIDATSGTAAQTADSTRIYGELDAATARNNAYREALGHQTAVMQLEEQGRAASLARKNRDIGRAFTAASTVLSMAGADADAFKGYK